MSRTDALYKKRFDELEAQLTAVEATRHTSHSEFFGSGEYVDDNLLLGWKVKAKDLLSKLCGEDSNYYKAFCKHEKPNGYTTNLSILNDLKSVFLATKEDFEKGYLTSLKSLVQADVFEDELEQAEELFLNSYLTAAAVIAGVVLETGIRELCDRNSISLGKLDKMNADLAKAGVYNKLTQKQITALADIRNSAAHGKPEEFTKQDVENMIRNVRSILAQHL